MGKLLTKDANDLARLEGIIRTGLQTFVEVGAALMEVKERGLYKEVCSTFEAYVQIRFGMSRARAYQQIAAAETVGLLSTTVDTGPLPENESQARPLTTLPPEQRPEAWAEAVAVSGGKPTAKDVQAAVDRRIPKPASAPKPERPEEIAAALFAKPEEKQRAERALEALTEEERTPLLSIVREAVGPDTVKAAMLENVADMPPEERAEVLELARSEDGRDRSLAKSRASKNPPNPDARFAILGRVTLELKTCIDLCDRDSDPSTRERLEALRTEAAALKSLFSNRRIA